MNGVGIDLLEIERLEAALLRRPTLAGRLFTAEEQAYSARRPRPGRHLAARFCAKEAVAKALDLRAWSYTDVEVISAAGAPTIRLAGAAQAAAAKRCVEVKVSLTHTNLTAAAVALATPQPAASS